MPELALAPDPAQSNVGRNDPRKRLVGPALTALLVSVATSVTPITQGFEGFEAKAARDPVGILTYCYGETANVDPSLIYSKSQCATKLRARMQKTFEPAILKCVPDFANPRNRRAFESSTDSSYNTGPSGFCRSRIAWDFNHGRWADGCRAFVGWRVTARGKFLPGLDRRRRYDAAWCLKGESA